MNAAAANILLIDRYWQGSPQRGGGTPGYGVQPHVAKRDCLLAVLAGPGAAGKRSAAARRSRANLFIAHFRT